MRVTTLKGSRADLVDKPKSREGLRWTPERLREKKAAKERSILATKLLHNMEERTATALTDYFREREYIPGEIFKFQFIGGCCWCEELREAGLTCCIHCGTLLNTY